MGYHPSAKPERIELDARRLPALVVFMGLVTLGVGGALLWMLYGVAVDQQRARLTEAARSQARLIEAVANFDAVNRADIPGGATAATLSQVREAHRNFEGFGETGEFLLGRLEGNRIVFLLNRRRDRLVDPPAPVPLASGLAEPMRRALAGRSGSMIGLDYDGRTVVAGYEPVPAVDIGIVAKIDLAEVRAPFLGAALRASLVAALLIGTTTFVYVRLSRRLIGRLEESERKHRILFETSNDGLFLMDRHGFVDCNEQACNFWRCSREDVIGHSPLDFSPPSQPDGRSSSEAARAYLERAFAGEPQFFCWRHRRGDGSPMEAEISLKAIEIEDSQLLLAAMRDVTERARAEEERRQVEAQLLQSQKMEAVGLLAGGVAHDFNNMLTGISGYAQLLLRRVDDSSMRADLEQIQTLATEAGGLTQQLLAFSRRQSLERKVLNLKQVVESTLKMLRRLIGEDVELNYTEGPAIGNVKVDQGQIVQVLLNLAVNARDAMPDGGTLTVAISNAEIAPSEARGPGSLPPGEYVRLAVRDTGVGMDEETRQRIFEPFFTTKGKGKGTGLGLSTVYGIVRQHDGDIEVKSSRSEGTTFEVWLPRVREPAHDEVDTAAFEPDPAGRETILLVEDEDAVRDIAQRTLVGLGYRVITASRPGEAEDLFAKHQPEVDLLLTDVVMPGKSGPELYEQLSSRRPTLPVLFMSGYPDRGSHRARGLGTEMPFIQKPFTPADLAKKIREVLEGSAAHVLLSKDR